MNELRDIFTKYKAVVFFDTETTGLEAESCQIIELAAIRVEKTERGTLRMADSADVFVKLPEGERIPQKIVELTGITDEQLENEGITEAEAAARFTELIGGGRVLLVAHNAQFDLLFTAEMLRRHGNGGPEALKAADYLDSLTVYKDRRAYPHKLANAILTYKLEDKVQNSHRAIDDVAALFEVCKAMPTMAQWGSKKWAVSSKQVVALEGLAFSYEQVADENTSTEDKKTTNERGTELFPLSFTTVLHSGAGVDVWAEIQSWKALVTKVNYFYLGGKKLGPKLQLRKVAVSNTKVDGKGRLLLATLSFTFKEYDPATTSVKVSTTALNVKASTASKSVKKTTNTAAKKAKKKTIKVGDYVKPTGSRYATGQKIPSWVKQRKHRVSQIKSSQNKVLLGHPNGINSWVYLSEVTLA